MNLLNHLLNRGGFSQKSVDPDIRKAEIIAQRIIDNYVPPTAADKASLNNFFREYRTFRDLVLLNYDPAKDALHRDAYPKGKENGEPSTLVIEGPAGLEKILIDGDHVAEPLYFTRIERGEPLIKYLSGIKEGGVALEVRDGEQDEEETWVSNPVYFDAVTRYKERWREAHPGQEFDVVRELRENFLPEKYVPNGTGGKKRSLLMSALYPGIKTFVLASTVQGLAGEVIMCGEKGLEATCHYESAGHCYQGGIIGILRTFRYDFNQEKIVPSEEIKFKVKKPFSYDTFLRSYVGSGNFEFKILERKLCDPSNAGNTVPKVVKALPVAHDSAQYATS